MILLLYVGVSRMFILAQLILTPAWPAIFARLSVFVILWSCCSVAQYPQQSLGLLHLPSTQTIAGFMSLVHFFFIIQTIAMPNNSRDKMQPCFCVEPHRFLVGHPYRPLHISVHDLDVDDFSWDCIGLKNIPQCMSVRLPNAFWKSIKLMEGGTCHFIHSSMMIFSVNIWLWSSDLLMPTGRGYRGTYGTGIPWTWYLYTGLPRCVTKGLYWKPVSHWSP